MGADLERGVPVPPLGRLARSRSGLDVGQFHGPTVVSHDVAHLPRHVRGAGITGFEGGVVAIGSEHHGPVLVADPVGVGGGHRSVERAQVLGTTENVGERDGVVDGHPVELRHRQVGDMTPRPALIEALVQSGVGPDHEVSFVGGVDPHHVVVAVLGRSVVEAGEGGAAVRGHVEEDVDLVHAIGIDGRGEQFLVVVGPGPPGQVLVASGPGVTPVGRAVEAALVRFGRLDGGVDQVWIGRGDGQADAPHLALGQAGGDPPPGGAPVRRAMDARARAAAAERPRPPPTLVGGGDQDVGVVGGEDDAGHPGVVVDGQRR